MKHGFRTTSPRLRQSRSTRRSLALAAFAAVALLTSACTDTVTGLDQLTDQDSSAVDGRSGTEELPVAQ